MPTHLDNSNASNQHVSSAAAAAAAASAAANSSRSPAIRQQVQAPLALAAAAATPSAGHRSTRVTASTLTTTTTAIPDRASKNESGPAPGSGSGSKLQQRRTTNTTHPHQQPSTTKAMVATGKQMAVATTGHHHSAQLSANGVSSAAGFTSTSTTTLPIIGHQKVASLRTVNNQMDKVPSHQSETKKCNKATTNASMSSSSNDSDDDSDSTSDSSSTTSENTNQTANKTKKTGNTPQFSVKHSDTGGLRMKFALSAATSTTAASAKLLQPAPSSRSRHCKPSAAARSSNSGAAAASNPKQPPPVTDGSSSSCCSACSDSDDSDTSSSSLTSLQPAANNKLNTKSPPAKQPQQQQQQRLVKKASTAKAKRKEGCNTSGNSTAGKRASASNTEARAATKATTTTTTSSTSSSSSSSNSSSSSSSSSDSDSSPPPAAETNNHTSKSSKSPATLRITSRTTLTAHSSPSARSGRMPKLTISTIHGGLPPRIRIPVPEHLVGGTDGASSSDMELPALVNAAIQRVESFSDDGDSNSKGASHFDSQYRSSLLQEFCAKTQMLQQQADAADGTAVGVTNGLLLGSLVAAAGLPAGLDADNNNTLAGSSLGSVNMAIDHTSVHQKTELAGGDLPASVSAPVAVKRKRGRPRKLQPPPPAPPSPPAPAPPAPAPAITTHLLLPSESPDSGITSTPHSPLLGSTASVSASHSDRGTPTLDRGKTAAVANSSSSSSSRRPAKKAPVRNASNSLAKEQRIEPAASPAPATAPAPVPSSASASASTAAPKLNLASLEKCMYATERVLYPPRRRKRAVSVAPTRSCSSHNQQLHGDQRLPAKLCDVDDMLDPAWRRIDINRKFRRPSTSGYRSDGGGTVCSKVLAAHSTRTYTGSYRCGSSRASVGGGGGGQSGYKSDYSCRSSRSRRSSVFGGSAARSRALNGGYKSDCNGGGGARSCGYRSDASSATRLSSVRRKRRVKTATKSPVTDLDILQLAGLSLGQSEESSRDSVQTNAAAAGGSSASVARRNRTPLAAECGAVSSRDILSNLCERVTRRLSGLDHLAAGDQVAYAHPALPAMTIPMRPGSIRCRRASAVSHCSSRSATSSYHPSSMRRHRQRRRLRSRCRLDSGPAGESAASKLQLQIEMLITGLSACRIVCNAPAEPDSPVTQPSTPSGSGAAKPTATAVPSATPSTSTSKRVQKKRKASEPSDTMLATAATSNGPATPTTGGGAVGGAPGTSKRGRNKKGAAATKTQSPDDHKLPLKKRHYLLSTDGKQATVAVESGSSPVSAPDDRTASSNRKQAATTPSTNESGRCEHPVAASPTTEHHPPAPSRKSSEIVRKKNRLEGLLSKIAAPQPPAVCPPSPMDPMASIPVHIISKPGAVAATNRPPPGVFEPTVDLELQIPASLPHIIAKTEIDSPRGAATMSGAASAQSDAVFGKLVKDEPAAAATANQPRGVLESLLSKTGANLILKRKRKKANRTGFPTVRRKKKKTAAAAVASSDSTLIELNDSTAHDSSSVCDEVKPSVELAANPTLDSADSFGVISKCDRVPQTGETASTFIERHSRPRLSVVSLERLQGKVDCDIKCTTAASMPMSGDSFADGLFEQLTTMSAKRTRDLSAESSAMSGKRLRAHESAAASISAPSPTLTDKSWPSDNEPLIRLVNKRIRKRRDSAATQHVLPVPVVASNLPVKPNGSNGLLVKNPFNKRSRKSVEAAAEHPASDTMPDRSLRFPVVKLKQLNQSQLNLHAPVAENASKPRVDPLSSTTAPDINLVRNPASSASSRKAKQASRKSTPNLLLLSDQPPDLADIKPFDPVEPLEHDPLPICDANESADWPADSTTDSETSSRKLGRSKRKYLVAGLFSDYFKQPVAAVGESPIAATIVDKASAASPTNMPSSANGLAARPSLLPAPAYCDTYFRRTLLDFQLPYDLWLAHTTDKLPGRHVVPSWNYKKIRTNVYIDLRAPVLSTEEQQVCSCKPATACGDDCLNRLMYTECSVKTCPCAERCGNTNIQRHITAPGVERFMTADKGWGVRTKQLIRKGLYILEYVGEVVTEREFKRRMETMYTQDTHHYCLNLDGGLVIDGHRMGSDGRFVNHSCAPNCEMQKWSVNGLFRMALFSLRDIRADEELTYDYNFALFNPAEGQPCRCGSEQCRGVIGGKSQRVKPLAVAAGAAIAAGAGGIGGTEAASAGRKQALSAKGGRTGRPRKNKANKNASFMHSKQRRMLSNYVPPSAKELALLRNGNCFLMRGIRRVRRGQRTAAAALPGPPGTLTAQISALRQPRNIRTRGVATAEHDPVIERTARIAGILRELCQELAAHKGKDGGGQGQGTTASTIFLLNLPSRKKCPAYYERIARPIDLSTIEANVERGTYTHPALFDDDVRRMFANAVRYYGPKSSEAGCAESLLAAYTQKKEQCVQRLAQIVPANTLAGWVTVNRPGQLLQLSVDPNEDIIRCICGLFVDEGVMIQCAECLVWQHTQCTGADTAAERYLCEQCDPEAAVNREIRLEGEVNAKGMPCFLSLLRGDLQVRQTDTVYVLRDIPIESDPPAPETENAPTEVEPIETAAATAAETPKLSPGPTPIVRKHTYETIGSVDFSECDIFRIEQLWKDASGRRFVYGHHYLRPHETYHEPTRKFYPNEVMRVPLYEEVPIEMIMGRCWVLDPTTFCKGRPVDSVEQHVYICELRVDKAARSFARIGKNQYPVCQKSYAFQRFEQKLKIHRNYMPHDVNLALPKLQSNKKKKSDEAPANSNHQANMAGAAFSSGRKQQASPIIALLPIASKTLNERRGRLEQHLARLALRLPPVAEDELPINLSYLLTGRGTRRRTNANNTNYHTNNVPA